MIKRKTIYPEIFKLRMKTKELEKLDKLAKKAKLSKSEYLRQLIGSVIPQERPDMDFYKTLTQLRYISNAVNQVAVKANRTGHIDTKRIEKIGDEIKPIANELYKYATLPIAMNQSKEIKEYQRYKAMMEEVKDKRGCIVVEQLTK